MDNFTDVSDPGLERYRNYLHLLARQQIGRKLGKKLDASDVVQDALLQAHVHQNQFRGKSVPERLGWLQTILTNEVAKAFRKFARRCRDVDMEMSLNHQLQQSSARLERWLAASASSPSEKYGRNEQILRLALALGELPVDQRDAIELHHLQGMTLDQVASELGRSKPSVAGLIFRGVTAIRRRLARINGDDHE